MPEAGAAIASLARQPLLVDSHCHLNFPDYKDDLGEVIARSRQVGVRVMQTICTTMEEFAEVLAIAEAHEGIYCSVGIHPNEVATAGSASRQQIAQKTAHPKVIGIGETGLDYHYEHSPHALQQKSFLEHIAAAQATGLPLIVHTRGADEDTVSLLSDEMQKYAFNGLIHCFSTSKYLAEKAMDIGMYISISGIISFKKAEELRDIVKDLPLERLLVETDAPYLAPVPYRGKRNEPSYVIYTNRLIAEIKGITEEECATRTTENFFRLFTKAKNPDL